MNQAPTRIKSRQEVNRYINKVGLMNQAPTRKDQYWGLAPLRWLTFWELGPGTIKYKMGIGAWHHFKRTG